MGFSLGGALRRLDELLAPTASVDLNNQRITNLGAPTSSADATTKAYADSIAAGLDPHASVRVATTVAGTLASSFENGDTIDGVVLVTGDRILIKNQASAPANGIYTVNASGAPTRATDADTGAELTGGAFTFVELGTTQAGSGWVATHAGTPTLGSSDITFSQFSSGWGGVTVPYTVTNATADRAFDASDYTTDELADVLGTLISDLQASSLPAPVGGTSTLFERTLASGSSVGATSLTLSASVLPASSQTYVAIDPFTTECEIRKPTISGTTLTVTALTYAHASGDNVIFFQGDSVPASWFGAKGDNSTDDQPALQWGMREVTRVGLWLDGENKQYLIAQPLVWPNFCKLKSFYGGNGFIQARSNYAPTGDPMSAMLIQQNTAVLGSATTFTVSGNTFTTTVAHNMTTGAAPKSRLVFQGANLPAPIVQGRIYWAVNVGASTFDISATKGGAAITITSAGNGLGLVFPNTPSLGRIIMDDVYVRGFSNSGVTTDGVSTFTRAASNFPSGLGLVFYGTTLPGGITSGVTYYVINPTTNTFQVSTTVGGSAVSLSSAGSGISYLSSVNGLIANLQQPSHIDNLRIDHCGGFGFNLGGQQATFYNLVLFNCMEALQLENAQFMYFYGFNAEQCKKAIHVMPAGTPFRSAADDPPLANLNLWSGVHIEMSASPSLTTDTIFDIEATSSHLVWDNVQLSNQTGQKVWHFHRGGGAESVCGYTIRDVFTTYNPANLGEAAIYDDDRGTTIDFKDLARNAGGIWAPSAPQTTAPSDNQFIVLGKSGRYMKWGPHNDVAPTLVMRPGTTQTADQIAALNSSGAKGSGINKGGYVHTKADAAPADADLVAGQLMFWFDTTNGAAKLMVKAKEAGGTVRTGSVTLS